MARHWMKCNRCGKKFYYEYLPDGNICDKCLCVILARITSRKDRSKMRIASYTTAGVEKPPGKRQVSTPVRPEEVVVKIS